MALLQRPIGATQGASESCTSSYLTGEMVAESVPVQYLNVASSISVVYSRGC